MSSSRYQIMIKNLVILTLVFFCVSSLGFADDYVINDATSYGSEKGKINLPDAKLIYKNTWILQSVDGGTSHVPKPTCPHGGIPMLVTRPAANMIQFPVDHAYSIIPEYEAYKDTWAEKRIYSQHNDVQYLRYDTYCCYGLRCKTINTHPFLRSKSSS